MTTVTTEASYPDRTIGQWRTASYSQQGNSCIEVGSTPDGRLIGVRDTKNRRAGTLTFSRAVWAAFLAGAKAGEFDRA